MTLALKQSDRSILDARKPVPSEEIQNPVLALPSLLETKQEILESDQVPVLSPDELRTLESVKQAVLASSGARKLLEATYGESGTVTIGKDEEVLLDTVERFFGTKSTTISFAMYKQALDALEEAGFEIQEEVIGGLI